MQDSAASNNSLFSPWPRPEFCCCQSWIDWLQSEEPPAGSVQAPLVPTAALQGHKAPRSLAKPGRSSRCPQLVLSSSLSLFFSLLLCPPTATDIPDAVPEPSHQPACNGIILMSVVLLPTHSTANTHSEVLGPFRSTGPDPEGF